MVSEKIEILDLRIDSGGIGMVWCKLDIRWFGKRI